MQCWNVDKPRKQLKEVDKTDRLTTPQLFPVILEPDLALLLIAHQTVNDAHATPAIELRVSAWYVTTKRSGSTEAHSTWREG